MNNAIEIQTSLARENDVNKALLAWVGLYGGTIIYGANETFTLEVAGMSAEDACDILVECEIINPIEDIWTCIQLQT